MKRSHRKTKISLFKQRLKQRLSKSLSRAKSKVARLRTSRQPRQKLTPSQRAPRKPSRVTTARPAVGAPTVSPIAPSVAPPLTAAVTTPPEMATHVAVAAAPPALPRHYGQTVLVLAVRDPWWVYAYWEVTPDRARTVQQQMSSEERAPAPARVGPGHYETVLRCYDVTERDGNIAHAHRTFDIVLAHEADNWFIDTQEAHRTWVAELGYRTAQGKFYALVRSNAVMTPRAGPSDQFDEAWMTTDEEYWKLLGVVYGLGFGTSSFEIRQLLERRFREVISSARGSVGVHAPTLTR